MKIETKRVLIEANGDPLIDRERDEKGRVIPGGKETPVTVGLVLVAYLSAFKGESGKEKAQAWALILKVAGAEKTEDGVLTVDVTEMKMITTSLDAPVYPSVVISGQIQAILAE